MAITGGQAVAYAQFTLIDGALGDDTDVDGLTSVGLLMPPEISMAIRWLILRT